MAGYLLLLAAYTIGGITFIPLLLIALFTHGYFFLPQPRPLQPLELSGPSPDIPSGALKEKLAGRQHESDVAAGYFAVCREYVPGGVNGKPPERTTPAGETIAAESPSVYQSMYRSIFERNKTQLPTIESGKAVKKARNVFYVVLRYVRVIRTVNKPLTLTSAQAWPLVTFRQRRAVGRQTCYLTFSLSC